MVRDHYESAYGSCEVELLLDYEERREDIARGQYRPFWCPSCGRTHNFRRLPEDEASEHRLSAAEPASVPNDAERDDDGQAIFSTDFSDANPGGSTSEDRHAESKPDDSAAVEATDESPEAVRVETSPVDPSNYTVAELKEKLADEDYDWNLPALRGCYESEVSGKARDTAIEAIERKMDSISPDEEVSA